MSIYGRDTAYALGLTYERLKRDSLESVYTKQDTISRANDETYKAASLRGRNITQYGIHNSLSGIFETYNTFDETIDELNKTISEEEISARLGSQKYGYLESIKDSKMAPVITPTTHPDKLAFYKALQKPENEGSFKSLGFGGSREIKGLQFGEGENARSLVRIDKQNYINEYPEYVESDVKKSIDIVKKAKEFKEVDKKLKISLLQAEAATEAAESRRAAAAAADDSPGLMSGIKSIWNNY
jgi:hypothetical protein